MDIFAGYIDYPIVKCFLKKFNSVVLFFIETMNITKNENTFLEN